MYKVVAALNDTKSAFTVISEVSENVSKSTFTVYNSSLHLKKYSMLESDYYMNSIIPKYFNTHLSQIRISYLASKKNIITQHEIWQDIAKSKKKITKPR